MTPDELKDFTILARQIEYQYRIAAFSDAALVDIIRVVDAARQEISDRAVFLDLPENTELLRALEQLTEPMQIELAVRIDDAAVTAGRYSYPAYNSIMSFDGAVVGFNSILPSLEQIRALVSAPVQDRYLQEWITVAVRDQLNIGVLQGESTVALADRVRRSFDGIERDVISLTRTYVAEMNNRALDDVYRANADIIREVEWNATLEVALNGHGTCLRCAGMDGRRFPVDSGPRPPLHLRCRCWCRPVTVTYRELGLNIPEIERAARPYTEREGGIPINVGGTRQIIDVGKFDGDFRRFLDERGEKYKLDLLGPGRYDLLRSGAIKWDDLVTRDGRLRLLKEL